MERKINEQDAIYSLLISIFGNPESKDDFPYVTPEESIFYMTCGNVDMRKADKPITLAGYFR